MLVCQLLTCRVLIHKELILTVLKSDQELTFDVLPSFVYGDLPFELDEQLLQV